MIRVQQEDFDIGRELAALTAGNHAIGGVAAFVGLVRDHVGEKGAGDSAISAMTLEHYPAMTEKMLTEIEAEASARWPLEASLVIHRYGRLEPGDQIVMVATASAHRQAAFEACAFLMDWLKTKAPFWKLEETGEGAQWVDARDSDDKAAARWTKRDPDAAE
ncbi:MAG TPA: molybdenum cofactor biosynthesis protein MoaE [Kiloniellaceae bacterium]